MGAYLVRFELLPGPPDKLPLSVGFLEAAEELGLLWVVRDRGKVHALPDGMVWGEFPNALAALKTFRRAVAHASGLLGFEIASPRAVAAALDLDCAPRAGRGRLIMPAFTGGGAFAVCLMHQLYAPPERLPDPVGAAQRRAALSSLF